MFVHNNTVTATPCEPGVSRKVMAYNDQVMMCEITFEKGAKGNFHTHPHVQTTYIVKAYKMVDGKKVITGTSVAVHSITKAGKYGVAKAVSIIKIGNKKNDTEVTLKKGKTAQITAIEIKKDKKIKHHRNLCYESSNTKVVTVTSDGVIKAMRKGNCKIWVYAQNGIYKVITVTVK